MTHIFMVTGPNKVGHFLSKTSMAVKFILIIIQLNKLHLQKFNKNSIKLYQPYHSPIFELLSQPRGAKLPYATRSNFNQDRLSKFGIIYSNLYQTKNHKNILFVY